MKPTTLIPSSLFALSLFALSASAAVPLRWTVETSRATPAQFEAYQGETLALEAALQSYGKPLETSGIAALYWQTNGMGSAYWQTTAAVNSNRLSAVFTPEMDVGAKVYNCFIGQPGTIYHAAFQLRLRPSPGASPNVLPLPTPVIDFAKVTVLNPPWGSGGGTDTNDVIAIIHKTVDGSARPLPKYLHEAYFDDSYPEEAAAYYASRGDGKVDGGCSAVRDGGFLYRNFDFPFDDRAEFVVHMSSGPARFASVGVAQVGTNLTEAIVTSGKPNRCYKWLPGATVDGINEHGVVAEINVVDGNPQTSGWHTNATSEAIHPLGAIRWILDHATNAQHAATYIAANIRFPQGWTQNFHYMIADESETWLVEDGLAMKFWIERLIITNFPCLDQYKGDSGAERYNLLIDGANITNAWYTRSYRRETNPPWVSDLADVIAYTNEIFDAWASHPKEYFRGKTNNGQPWWQSVHTSIYDISNRVLRVAVQETDDFYTFQVPASGGAKIDAYTKSETDAKLAGKLDGPTDSTLALPGRAADAAAVGNALEQKIGVEGGTIAGDLRVIGSMTADYFVSGDVYSDGQIHDSEGNELSAKADRSELPTTPGEVGAYPAASGQQLAGQVGTIGAHLNAEDARFVSTNYNSATHMPEAYVEIKLPDQTWAVIWREMTRWNWFFDEWLPAHLYTKSQVDAMLAEKADRAWGYYDSHSGTYAPDGYTWISSPKVALAAGLGYQRTVTAEGAIWVLESNGLVTETGGVASNGFFRISDDEGNVQFEIVKGNKRTIGADASSFQTVSGFAITKLQIGYSVVSDAHPTLRICGDLTTHQWKDETDPDCLANVTWEGQSGAWVAYVQGKTAQPALFVKATYEVGGETHIRNVAPVSMEYLYIGGVKYAVGTATISGHTVLTLTPAN